DDSGDEDGAPAGGLRAPEALAEEDGSQDDGEDGLEGEEHRRSLRSHPAQGREHEGEGRRGGRAVDEQLPPTPGRHPNLPGASGEGQQRRRRAQRRPGRDGDGVGARQETVAGYQVGGEGGGGRQRE